ncbi:MAG: hypothetical protein IT585_06090, partial [candidate division Zixibacteria bacterium]|nr:hypothetical protein [candidate division Zixibacteria bacterium]
MRKYLLIILLIGSSLLFGTRTSYAQISDAAVLFLRIAPNARSAGMGEAFVAIADDASSTHWNPAGLGEYPLAHAWYQFSLGDDSRLKELAQQAFDGKLTPEFYEKIQGWQVKGNAISRLNGEEWVEYETISIDPNRTLLANLSRRLAAADKERFKQAVRKICFANTGVSFDEINGIRTSLLKIGGKASVDRINALAENLLMYWQDLRLNIEAFNTLKQRAADVAADVQLADEELTEIESLATACETQTRPSEIQVPYAVLLSVWRGWNVPWEQRI